MDSLSFIGSIAVLGLVYFLVNRYYAWQQLSHIPGPFLARFTHLWIMRYAIEGKYIDKLLELHKTYGPMVILAPDFVSVSDVEEIKRIGRVRSSWGRAPGYQAFRSAPGAAGDSIVSVRDDSAHARMRTKLMPGYAGKTVQGVEQMVDEHVLQLIKVIETRHITIPGSDYRPVDFSRLAQYLTVDVITSFAFQESFSCLERDADFYGYLNAVSTAVAPLLACAFSPLYQRIMDTPMLGAIFPDGGFFPKVFEMARRQVGKRFGAQAHELQEKNDVLGSWVAAGLGEAELINETVAQLTAGGETTGTGIRAAMLYLAASPRSYQALQREIDEALHTEVVRSCPLAESEVGKLPYLQAVVKESLRLFVPAAFFPKSSPNDEILCGFSIPAGVSVELAYKVALRSKEIFGEDAESFRPERWINIREDKLTLMDETFRFVFGGPSRWECLGKGLAFMEMHKVIFELFRQFDITLVDPTSPWKASGTRIWGIKDFYVQITKRSQAVGAL
ncbi:cytochrome P450 [Xylariales sp. PMI_506]|nr:cytochrome P450 [Xylariales sp. PMI_506]